MRARERSAPAWLPDWRNASLYPTQLTDSEWRWQFLRRHPEYQSLWDQKCDPQDIYTIFLDGRNTTTNDPERAEFLRRQHPSVQTLRALYLPDASRFGVRCVLDPALESIPTSLVRGFWIVTEQLDALEFGAMFARGRPSTSQWERWEKARQHMVAVVIDLRLDIDQQIASRRSTLSFRQGELRPPARIQRKHRKLWSTYLRVLDARSAGETWRSIGKVPGLLSKRQRENDAAKYAEQLHKQARRVREEMAVLF